MKQKNKSSYKPFYKISNKGLDKKVIAEISDQKCEPGWMIDFRLKSFEIFQQLPMPNFGPNLSELKIEDLFYYVKPLENKKRTWDDVPDHIKETFEKLGVPEAERSVLAGVGAQFDSEIIYKQLKSELEKQGVVFSDLSDGLKNFPEIFKKYFSTVVLQCDNKFAALNGAVWSGGSFVYVPEGVEVKMPLQAYFRIDSQQFGQFERTLIIAEPRSRLHYVEGCSAPVYSSSSLHCGVVEIIARENSNVCYSTIQNWSKNVYNLVTKRAVAEKNATMQWIDGNFGSKITMKYPCTILKGQGATCEVISVSVAGKDQIHDSGAKIIHKAPNTSSHILSKSLCKDGGYSNYRGSVKVEQGAINSKSKIACHSILLDDISRAGSCPQVDVSEIESEVEHEAFVSKLNQEKLFYLIMHGMDEQAARALLVNGIVEPFVSRLPMEYAVEINRLVSMEMEEL